MEKGYFSVKLFKSTFRTENVSLVHTNIFESRRLLIYCHENGINWNNFHTELISREQLKA